MTFCNWKKSKNSVQYYDIKTHNFSNENRELLHMSDDDYHSAFIIIAVLIVKLLAFLFGLGVIDIKLS